jgi:deoxyribose-phosphate aldolase|tara:strand:- start:8336 stop:8968 length:633 start_codon:yes stop_codon:yes gene_type:complete
MYLEFCNYNKSYVNDINSQVKEVFEAIDLGLKGVAIPLYLANRMSEDLSHLDITVACPVDYPTGTGGKKVRLHETLSIAKTYVNTIDLVLNPLLVKEEKLLDLRKEIESHIRVCKDYNSTLRVIIHHNLYPLDKSLSLARIVEDAGGDTIIPSAGFHNDDIFDNLLTAKLIENKTSIKSICNGYIWLEDQYNMVIESKVHGLRIYSLNML